MLAKFLRPEFPASWVLVVVTMDLRVAFETDWNRIVDTVRAALSPLIDMIRLNLDAAESVTDAAPPVAFNQKFVDLSLIEFA